MEETEKSNKMTLAVFSGDLDKALSAFILATTAASMGMEVKMFFTFWGLNIIKKNEGGIKSSGFMRKMLNMINRGGAGRLTMSRYNFIGVGTGMMKQLMKDVKMPSIEEFITMAHGMGVKMYPCSTSIGVMGIDATAFRPEVEETVGAAFFLGEAADSKVSYFI